MLKSQLKEDYLEKFLFKLSSYKNSALGKFKYKRTRGLGNIYLFITSKYKIHWKASMQKLKDCGQYLRKSPTFRSG